MYFPSKRDTWLGLIIWLPFLVVVIIEWMLLNQGQFDPIAVFILVPVVAFIAWIWFGTGYEVTDRELKIKSGPIRQTIPLEKITNIGSTRNPISSPALSLDRLEINYGEGSFTIISPLDKEGFINLIVSKNPNVTINGNEKLKGPRKTRMKAIIGVAAVITLITVGGTGILLYFSNKPAEYAIENSALRISGVYGEEIKISEITEISLKEQIPPIQRKTNGSALGSKKKGYFTLKGIGKAKLFVNTQKPPFIFINVKSGLRIVNTEDPTETSRLYNKLSEAWALEISPWK